MTIYFRASLTKGEFKQLNDLQPHDAKAASEGRFWRQRGGKRFNFLWTSQKDPLELVGELMKTLVIQCLGWDYDRAKCRPTP